MPATAADANLRIVIEGEARNAIAAFKAVQGQAQTTGMSARTLRRTFDSAGGGIQRQIGAVAAATGGISAAIIRVGREAVETFGDYEQSLSRIEGLVGINRQQIDEWGQEIIRLAPEVGQTPQALGDALFFATSAGLEGTRALEAVVASARAATGGLGELSAIVDAATSAMNAYDPSVLSASQATDILVATVREGKLEAGDLAGVIGDVIPLAAQMGVEFHEIGGLVAALSRTGSDASKAVTGIRAALRSLSRPGQAAKEVLDAAVGTFDDFGAAVEGSGIVNVQRLVEQEGPLLAFKAILDGLFENAGVQSNEAFAAIIDNIENVREQGGDLQDLTLELGDALGEGGNVLSRALGTIFADSKGLLAVLDLLGPSFETNVEIANELERDFEAGTATQDAFAAATETIAFNIASARASWEGLLATFGEALAPSVGEALMGITTFVTNLTERFRELDPEQQQAFVRAIGAIAGIAAVAGIASTLALIANPVGLIAAAIAGLGAGALFIVENWEEVVEFLRDLRAGFVELIPEGVVNTFETVIGRFEDLVGFIRSILRGDASLSQLAELLTGLLPPFLVENLLSYAAGIGQVVEAIRGLLSGDLTVGQALQGIVSGLRTALLAPMFNTFNALAEGIVGILNKAIDPINRVLTNREGEVRGLFRAIGITEPLDQLQFSPLQIPAFQRGGVVTEPTLALIGEAGPEAVVPLTDREASLLSAEGLDRYELARALFSDPSISRMGGSMTAVDGSLLSELLDYRRFEIDASTLERLTGEPFIHEVAASRRYRAIGYESEEEERQALEELADRIADYVDHIQRMSVDVPEIYRPPSASRIEATRGGGSFDSDYRSMGIDLAGVEFMSRRKYPALQVASDLEGGPGSALIGHSAGMFPALVSAGPSETLSEASLMRAATELAEGVVAIASEYQGRVRLTSSGFIIRSEGADHLVLTNAHSVEEPFGVEIAAEDFYKVVTADALIHDIDRIITTPDNYDIGLLEAAITSAPGSSGGPLLNAAGLVVGVIRGGVSDTDLASLVIPLEAVQRFMEEELGISFMQEGGVVTEPTLAVIGEAGPEAVVPLRMTRAQARAASFPQPVDDATLRQIVLYHGSDESDADEWELEPGVLWTTTLRALAEEFLETSGGAGSVQRITADLRTDRILDVPLVDEITNGVEWFGLVAQEAVDRINEGLPRSAPLRGREAEGGLILDNDALAERVAQSGAYDAVRWYEPGRGQRYPRRGDDTFLEDEAMRRRDVYAITNTDAVSETRPMQMMVLDVMEPFREGFSRAGIEAFREMFDRPPEGFQEGFDRPPDLQAAEGFSFPPEALPPEGYDPAPRFGGLVAAQVGRPGLAGLFAALFAQWPRIPHLQEGGIVTEPTLAMIGEAGPEAVIPLDRFRSGESPLDSVEELTRAARAYEAYADAAEDAADRAVSAFDAVGGAIDFVRALSEENFEAAGAASLRFARALGELTGVPLSPFVETAVSSLSQLPGVIEGVTSSLARGDIFGAVAQGIGFIGEAVVGLFQASAREARAAAEEARRLAVEARRAAEEVVAAQRETVDAQRASLRDLQQQYQQQIDFRARAEERIRARTLELFDEQAEAATSASRAWVDGLGDAADEIRANGREAVQLFDEQAAAAEMAARETADSLADLADEIRKNGREAIDVFDEQAAAAEMAARATADAWGESVSEIEGELSRLSRAYERVQRLVEGLAGGIEDARRAEAESVFGEQRRALEELLDADAISRSEFETRFADLRGTRDSTLEEIAQEEFDRRSEQIDDLAELGIITAEEAALRQLELLVDTGMASEEMLAEFLERTAEIIRATRDEHVNALAQQTEAETAYNALVVANAEQRAALVAEHEARHAEALANQAAAEEALVALQMMHAEQRTALLEDYERQHAEALAAQAAAEEQYNDLVARLAVERNDLIARLDKERFEAAQRDLKALLDAGIISYDEYLNRNRELFSAYAEDNIEVQRLLIDMSAGHLDYLGNRITHTQGLLERAIDQLEDAEARLRAAQAAEEEASARASNTGSGGGGVDVGGAITGGVSGAATGAALGSVIPGVGTVVGAVVGGVAGFFGGLFGLQEGGIVTQPTRALIGEAGPEAVIPLDRLEIGRVEPLVADLIHEVEMGADRFERAIEIQTEELAGDRFGIERERMRQDALPTERTQEVREGDTYYQIQVAGSVLTENELVDIVERGAERRRRRGRDLPL